MNKYGDQSRSDPVIQVSKFPDSNLLRGANKVIKKSPQISPGQEKDWDDSVSFGEL